MLHCFYENPTASLELSLPAAWPDSEAILSPVEDALTTSAAVEALKPSSAHDPHPCALDVRLQLCTVRLLRDLAFKGRVLFPFIPTTQLLLLLPCSLDPTSRTRLAPGAEDKMAALLSSLLHFSGGVSFRVASAMLCVTSGCAALVLECGTLDGALALQDACDEINQQGLDVRMSSLYIKAYLCRYVPQCDLPDPSQEKNTWLNELYCIPTCTLCAERLEPTLTGACETPNMPVCGCLSRSSHAASATPHPQQGSCTCLQTSACSVCQQLLSAQVASSTTNGATPPQVRCQECRQAGDPWICMICGYVGCSRYQAMHAKDHFFRTHHLFSINLLTQQIWDYHSDAFVHHVMFIIDAKSGKTTRLQYPGHEDPTTSELLGAEESAVAAAGWVDGGGETLLGGSPGTGAEKPTWDPVAEKKVVSSKYDAKLTTSHTQYATVIKNELDAMRAAFTESTWADVIHIDPDTSLTQADVARLLEHTQIILPNEESPGNQLEGTEETSRENEDKSGDCSANALEASDNPKDQYAVSNTKLIDAKENAGKEENLYDRMFASLGPLATTLTSTHWEEQSITFGIQNLTHELEMREAESATLEVTESELTSELRDVVRQNVMDNLALNNAIDELQSTLREIALNVSTQQQLQARLGSGDGTARMVVMGQGKEARKEKQRPSKK